ncbi:hypothetical protein BCF44_12633 [Kutzneria buriramensis]|uniref:Uncharacterized protein n=1 Tax=Kutzneria buriramensis TaxID=1045776 RepID=A0A3E0GUM4_9PSEU|nr:hypothetical protein BCF44_12633 [Kutzneria buriramensis]
MSRSDDSPVVVAANRGEFGTEGGHFAPQSTGPVTCAIVRTLVAGFATAFLTSIGVVEAYRRYGGVDRTEPLLDGPRSGDLSVRRLADIRLAALDH